MLVIYIARPILLMDQTTMTVRRINE